MSSSQLCHKCKKSGYFKDEHLKSEREEIYKDEQKKKIRTRNRKINEKAFEATWSDSSEWDEKDDDKDSENKVQSIICLLANSSDGKYNMDGLF